MNLPKLRILLAVAVALSFPLLVWAAVLVDDQFADGNSQNQDLAHHSLRLFNGRTGTVRTDAVGSVSFDVANAGGSDGFWAFFTDESPVRLGVGDRLAVAGTFSLQGFQMNGQDMRFGLFDSLGTRTTGNPTGGMNHPSFVGDPGYNVQFYASGSGSPFRVGRRTTLSSPGILNTAADFTAIPGLGATTRQALVDDTSYTLTYTIERLSDTETRVSVEVTGGQLSDLRYSAVESHAAPNASFDTFGFRIGGPNFARKITFTRLLVDYSPAPPVITSHPQPSSFRVQVGSNISLSVGASGSQLSYLWHKDAVHIAGNPSAASPTLALTDVQLADSGRYTAVVSNPGGSATSNPVDLTVTSEPVAPPPIITAQPANTTVIVGAFARLSVVAGGDGLVYQWFKYDKLITSATNAILEFPSAQVSDSGTYRVVVSNSSGSITSSPATLLVLSPMSAVSVAPATGASGVCIDTPLIITFDRPAMVGNTGRIRVFRSDGMLVDTIDMGAGSHTRRIGGAPVAFNYYPIIVTGQSAAITLHHQLEFGQSYFITLEPGVITDDGGAPFAGLSDPDTWRFSTKSEGPPVVSSELTVAADGTGDFCTVQGAVDFVPANNTRRIVINVRMGIYTEIVYVRSNKPFLTVRGEDREKCVVQYANNNALNGAVSGLWRAMFGVDAPDFTLENITLINTTGKGGSQAEAFRGNNQRIVLNRVTLKSYQDTLLLQGTGFVNDCYIEGDVDFMWGNGTVFFRNCELRMVSSGGYYTQIRNTRGLNGNVYVNCRLTGLPNVSGAYLSRIDPNVYPDSQVVFINCAMGPHILPVGWLLNNAASAPDVQFWEYRSTDLDGVPLDVSRRAPFSRQLTDAEVEQWADPGFVLGGWMPSLSEVKPPQGRAGDVVPSDAAEEVSDVPLVAVTETPSAFPGAEGFGSFAVGGRGGDVYHVTNLNDSGSGSLRYGIQTAAGPRTIVFDVSGTIYLRTRLTINKPFLTLAGQTAPGDGVTVAGWTTLISNTHDVVVRYMRFRPGDINCPQIQDDSLSVNNSTDIMIDHVSASWSIDETLSVTASDRVTVQWSFITESLNDSCHAEGSHGFGTLLRYSSGGITFHHNLYAHHRNRSPRLGDDIHLDFVNNVVYNWVTDSGYSGAAEEGTPRLNYIGNYLVAGPSTPSSRRTRAFRGGSTNTFIFQSDNVIDFNVNRVRDGLNIGWAMITGSYTQVPARFDFPQVGTDDAGTAYFQIVESAGASLVRDPVDTRLVMEVMNDAGGIIDSQNQVGGWPDLEALPPPFDGDRDGMPDDWEIANGLDPLDPGDGSVITESGYSNLEIYLNSLVESEFPSADSWSGMVGGDNPGVAEPIARSLTSGRIRHS